MIFSADKPCYRDIEGMDRQAYGQQDDEDAPDGKALTEHALGVIDRNANQHQSHEDLAQMPGCMPRGVEYRRMPGGRSKGGEHRSIRGGAGVRRAGGGAFCARARACRAAAASISDGSCACQAARRDGR